MWTHTPVYHIDSRMHVTDMVTKPRQMYIVDINAESLWQTGMMLQSDRFPKIQNKMRKKTCFLKSTRVRGLRRIAFCF